MKCYELQGPDGFASLALRESDTEAPALLVWSSGCVKVTGLLTV